MKTPYLLIAFRFLLAPTILIFSYYTEESIARLWIIVFIILGLLSDIFDGIIARQMGISTVKMRRMDSQTDLVFWLSIGIACYHLNPELIKTYRYEVIAIFIMEGLCYTISFLKFGKETFSLQVVGFVLTYSIYLPHRLWSRRISLAISYLLGALLTIRCDSHLAFVAQMAKRYP